jgi:MFS family permease
VSASHCNVEGEADVEAAFGLSSATCKFQVSTSDPLLRRLTPSRWGRKPILLSAVVVFLVSSIICALAVDMKMLIAGRALQGAAGGGLIMMVNVVISDIFSMRYDFLPSASTTALTSSHQSSLALPRPM